MSSQGSVAIAKVSQIVPMEDPATLLMVAIMSSGEVRRGAIARLGDEAMATVSGLREVASEGDTFVGILLRCRSVEDARAWLDAPLKGKSVVFSSAFE